MSKRKIKKSFLFLDVPWLSALILGIALGVGSQRIPELRGYTDKITYPMEQYLATTTESRFPDHPISSFHINRSGYSLAYDARNRNPSWVYEHLTAESIKGSIDRSNCEFKEDESIPFHLRATPTDYRGQGFDRGHMAPAADHRSCLSAMEDTFYMTNMCPQCPQFNRGYWAKLEKYIRDLTKQYASVQVVTGPLYLPYTDCDGKSYVKYQVIGPNYVAVPTHFFKVIELNNGFENPQIIAYILPNANIPSHIPFDRFQTSIQKVEQAAGIIFKPAL